MTGRKKMTKTYVIWWHSKFVDEINHDNPTIATIVEKTKKTLMHLQELQELEEKGKITMKLKGSLNPIYLQIKDPTVESILGKNPLVKTLDT
jgi:Asp-tRNA(Asn)/Glu-tRNA(Gln) amidotransferase B subunit